MTEVRPFVSRRRSGVTFAVLLISSLLLVGLNPPPGHLGLLSLVQAGISSGVRRVVDSVAAIGELSRSRAEVQKLRAELLSESKDDYEDYVTDVTRRMIDSYKIATAGVTDPTARATAREVAIAQAREEIIGSDELLNDEPDEDEARDFLRDFYGGRGI